MIGDLDLDGQLQNNVAGAAPDDTGVILRLLQDGAPAPGNPSSPYCSVDTFLTCASDSQCPNGQTCRTKVAKYFAYGIRNSFGLAIDELTGDLWDTENGPSDMDEVNRVERGMNSGWRDLMGPDALDPDGTANLFNMPGAGLTYSDPEFTLVDTNAPTAIVFPNGSTLGGDYNTQALVANHNFGEIFAFPLNASRTGFALTGALADLVANTRAEADTALFAQGFGRVTDLKFSPDGDLYVVDIERGTVYRISGPAAPVPVLPTAAALLLAVLLAGVVGFRALASPTPRIALRARERPPAN